MVHPAARKSVLFCWRERLRAALFVVLCLFALPALAQYPALSGRIVDGAGIIPADKKQAIETKLQALEEKSGIQLVVATIASLEGNVIEPYANALFREWKLGEKTKNNGVLLIIAPKERKVRIEVGYGLEGTLTDALSKVIISNAIAPRFKAGDYAGGVERGVDDIITVLTTDAAEWQARPKIRADETTLFDQILPFLILAIFVFVFISMIRNARGQSGRYVQRGNRTIFIPSSGGGSGWSGGGSSWGSGGSSGGGGSSWGGGGGSSGGGGASGDW